jgi:hypothetical protein
VGSASAEVRSGSVTDPADATLHQNVDGTSHRDQDIQRVTASYDTAGSITMTFYFLDPVPDETEDALQAFVPAAPTSYGSSCWGSDTPGTALLTVFPTSGPSAIVTLDGYDGSIRATTTLSADHRAITVQASAAVLANRAYTCVGPISLSHLECDYTYHDICLGDYSTVTTDDTDTFSIDAATPAVPAPEPEEWATPTPTTTVTPSHRCVTARKALRKHQKQLHKLKARLRSAHTRKRKTALARQIRATRRGIARTRAVIEQRC